jgi:hypothetical protein
MYDCCTIHRYQMMKFWVLDRRKSTSNRATCVICYDMMCYVIICVVICCTVPVEKSVPNFISGYFHLDGSLAISSCKRITASLYGRRTNGSFTNLLSLVMRFLSINFSKKAMSSLQVSKEYLMTYFTNSSAFVIAENKSAKAISGSIMLNSAKCLVVWLFSALNVGPKV